MAKDNKVRMPMGQGGLIRSFDEKTSNFEISPGGIIVMCMAVMAIVIVLHFVGA